MNNWTILKKRKKGEEKKKKKKQQQKKGSYPDSSLMQARILVSHA